MRWIGLLVLVGCGLAALAVTGVLAPPARQADAGADAGQEYRSRFAPDLLGRKADIDELVQRIEVETAPADRERRYTEEVLPRLGDLLADTEDYRPATPRIAAAHEHAVAALRLAGQAAAETVRGYRAGADTAVLTHARRLTDTETAEWRAWLDAVLAL